MSEELKKCPFCGDSHPNVEAWEETTGGYGAVVYCCDCGGQISADYCDTSDSARQEAIGRWNSRYIGREQAARIEELEQMAEARKLANRLLEQERNELKAERDQLREALEEAHITSNARREKIIVLKAERDRLREALAEAVEKYGKPGGPWNVPGEPGSWIDKARKTLEGAGE